SSGNLLLPFQSQLLTKFQRDNGVGYTAGPLNRQNTKVTRYDVDISHSFSENLHFILNYNWMKNKMTEDDSHGFEGLALSQAPGQPNPGKNELLMATEARWPTRVQNNVTAVLNYNFKRDWIDLQVVAGMEYYSFNLDFTYLTLNPPGQAVNFVTLAGYTSESYPTDPALIRQNIIDKQSTQWAESFFFNRKQTYKAPYLLFNSSFFDNQLRVIAGVRRDDISIKQMFYPSAHTPTDGFALGPGQLTDTPDSATTPLLGVSVTPFKDERGFTIYSSYSKSLLANEIVNPNGTTLPPEQGEGLEVGVKYDISKRLSATLSWFDIKNTGVPLGVVGSNPYSWVAGGLQESKGEDFDLFYAITPNWQLLSSGAIFNAVYVTDTSPINVGKQLGGVPKWSVSLWNKYTF